MISKLAEKACDLRFSPWCNLLKGAVHRHELPGPLRGAGENHDLYLQLIFLIVSIFVFAFMLLFVLCLYFVSVSVFVFGFLFVCI